MPSEQIDASPSSQWQKVPTHAVLHFSDNWWMDGLAVEYFDSLDEALEYAETFEVTKAHEKDSLIVTEIKGTAKVGADGRFQVKRLSNSLAENGL